SLADVARELDVQAVVEGSVLRVGDRVRITAQLIRVPADEHLWAHSYEGSFPDTLMLQGEVSQAIARQILATLSPRDEAALSEANTSLAFALDISTWDWSGAEREFRRALDLNPGYATAHHWYGYHLMMVGRDDEGIAELKRAESLDPLSLIISAGVADVLFIA